MRSALITLFCTLALAPMFPGSVFGDPPATGPIRVVGLEKTRPHIIRRELGLRPGQPFNRATLDAFDARLFTLPGIDYSEVRTRMVGDSVAIDIVVTEESEFGGRPRIYRGRETDFVYGLALFDNNFRGLGERWQASATFGAGTDFWVSWENPWWGSGPRIGTALSTQFESYDYVYDDAPDTVSSRGVTRSTSTAKLFWSNASGVRLGLQGGWHVIDADDTFFLSGSDRDAFASADVFAALDRTDSDVFPFRGVRADGSIGRWGLGDDEVDMTRARARLSAYHFVTNHAVLAGNIRGVMQDGDAIPFYQREHLGGSTSLRGFDFGAFAGNESVSGTVELRIPIGFSRDIPIEDALLGLVLFGFVDGGRASLDSGDIETTNGAGAAILLGNVGAIRADYGWRENGDGRWNVDVGLAF